MTRMLLFSLAAVFVASLAAPGALRAQNNSLFPNPREAATREAMTAFTAASQLESGSWTYVPQPLPRQFRIGDFVKIRVNEISRMTADSEMQRRRNASYDAVLADWPILNGLRWVKPSPQSDGDPRVQGRLNQLYRAEGEMETSERLTLNIQATIVDIRPNGTLVLEAHKRVQNNNETWEVSLSGLCRAEDINEDNMLLSEQITDLSIAKRELGHVRDSYKRGWMTKALDRFSPF
jgi:flagellar L-ring protein FlgH